MLAKLPRLLRPKRRWAQFSLTALLLLTTALCAVLGLWIVPAERQRRAVVAIQAGGGHVKYVDDPQGATVTATKATQPGLPRDYLSDVQDVYLNSDKVTDADAALGQVRELTQVRRLALRRGWLTDAGLGHLKGLTHLEEVRLDKETQRGLRPQPKGS